eukprot:TRINITY_DN1999_c0_g1_i1.p1 TRINITY_DN1999_c0_g1~~TRINITY_DN1999_c0_g1_i1.p1  ORF type:complete len:142 (-),score=59.13 TRINITY_DN1999_c0_g1_i1:124-549(-)
MISAVLNLNALIFGFVGFCLHFFPRQTLPYFHSPDRHLTQEVFTMAAGWGSSFLGLAVIAAVLARSKSPLAESFQRNILACFGLVWLLLAHGIFHIFLSVSAFKWNFGPNLFILIVYSLLALSCFIVSLFTKSSTTLKEKK